MASQTYIYNEFSKYLMDGTIDLANNSIYVSLHTSAYAPSLSADTVWADVGSELSDASYATGGVAMAGLSVSETGGTSTWDANNVTFSTLTGTFRYGVIYVNATVDSVVKPLIAYLLFDDTPGDVTVSASDFTISWNSSGIITLG